MTDRNSIALLLRLRATRGEVACEPRHFRDLSEKGNVRKPERTAPIAVHSQNVHSSAVVML